MGTGGEEGASGETCDDLEVVRALRSRSLAPAWSVRRLPLRCPTTRYGGAISFLASRGSTELLFAKSRLRAKGVELRGIIRVVGERPRSFRDM